MFGHGEGARADGLSSYSRELVCGLRRRGVEVGFFWHREDGARVPVEPPDAIGLRAWHWKTVVVPRPGSLARIRDALARLRPEVVHISWSFSLHDAAIVGIARSLGARAVATFHLPHGPRGSMRGRVLSGLYRYHRFQMRELDRCIALSDEQGELLVRAGFPRARLTVISNGVDTTAITPGPSQLHHELGARIVVLYLGRLDPEKRVGTLVASFLSLGLPADHVLCIAGDGSLRERLRRICADRSNLRLLGLVSDSGRRLELLRGCDVFVLPSTAEGLALSLLEAMAAGCAIVATDAGEDGRALGDAGLVVPTHPLRPGLDDALRRLIADDALRARLGSAARQRAVTHFDVERTLSQVLAVYAGDRRGRVATE